MAVPAGTGARSKWSSVNDQLIQLLTLEPNWDSYGAPAIDPAAVGYAAKFLALAVPTAAPVPAVLASPSGGVQFEWHERGVDLEVEALPGGRFGLYYRHRAKSVDREIEDTDLNGAVEFSLDPIKQLL